MAGHVRYTAVIDACVFYGMLKTDALMSLCVWKNPHATPDDFCAVFEKNKLLSTAQRLRDRIELI